MRYLCALAALFAMPLTACTEIDPPSASRRPDVILIVLDTVRADHLGCYGYARDTTPRIDAFARGATLYRHAVATSPWTLPSHASLFTGLFPYEHGVRTYPPRGVSENLRPLDPDITTLAEVLRGDGYRTGAFVANTAFLAPAFGLDQGFEEWTLDRSPAPRLNRRVFDWVSRREEQPFFLFVNYMDAHRVYNTESRRSFVHDVDPRDRGEPLERLLRLVLPGQQDAPRDLVQRVIDEYDTAITVLDDAVADLIAFLQRAGRLDNALIVIVSDHGEAFGEHRLVEHGQDLYQETLGIPLLIKQPRQRQGRTVDAPLSLAQVPYLVLEAVATKKQGPLRESFAPPILPGLVIAENYYSRSRYLHSRLWGHRFQRTRHAILDWPFKYIESSDGHHELYDLSSDPGELLDILANNLAVAERLSRTLTSIRAAPRAQGGKSTPVEVGDEFMRRLRGLGYL